MKQYITVEQLRDLSLRADKRFYREFRLHNNYPRIGMSEMIDYIGEDWYLSLFYGDYDCSVEKSYDGELCDALWELLKEELEK